MKVLHVNMMLDRVNGGGTVERVIQMHKALRNEGTDSHILTVKSTNEESILPSEEVTALPCLNHRWFIPFPMLRKVKALIVEADMIHMMNHWTFINVLVYCFAISLNKPYVICPAGALTIFGRSKRRKKLFQTLIGKKILKNARAVIAITADEATLIESLGVTQDRIELIANGVSAKDFDYVGDDLFRHYAKIEKDIPYILFVGRLNEIKGPDILVEAFKNVSEDIVHDLVFIGPDEGMKSGLERQVKELGIEGRVHFVGYASGELKSSAYHGASVLVVPSRHEAMSIVALEAAISSTPVILTDQCDFSSLCQSGGGIEVSATADGVSKGLMAMSAIGESGLSEMGQRGREFALKHYSWSIAAKKIMEIANCSG